MWFLLPQYFTYCSAAVDAAVSVALINNLPCVLLLVFIMKAGVT